GFILQIPGCRIRSLAKLAANSTYAGIVRQWISASTSGELLRFIRANENPYTLDHLCHFGAWAQAHGVLMPVLASKNKYLFVFKGLAKILDLVWGLQLLK